MWADNSKQLQMSERKFLVVYKPGSAFAIGRETIKNK